MGAAAPDIGRSLLSRADPDDREDAAGQALERRDQHRLHAFLFLNFFSEFRIFRLQIFGQALHFPLENIVDGYGVAPIAPPIPDFVKAMGRTNDAIIYGGRIQLFVRGSDDAASKLAEQLPSNTCSIYGKPFAEIFSSVGGDFYKIDAMLFSPAVVTVSNLDTGASFHAGKLAPEIVDASFR